MSARRSITRPAVAPCRAARCATKGRAHSASPPRPRPIAASLAAVECRAARCPAAG